MRDSLEPYRVLEWHDQSRHAREDLIIPGQCSYLAPELALVVKCGVVSFRLGHERDALSAKRKLHWDPDIVEDHIFRQTFKVGAPDHCDGAGHADHTAETRFLLPNPVFIAPVNAAAGFSFDDEIAGCTTHSGVRHRIRQCADRSWLERLPDIIEQNQIASRERAKRVQACWFSASLRNRDNANSAACRGCPVATVSSVDPSE